MANKTPRIKREPAPEAPKSKAQQRADRKEQRSKIVKIVLVALGCLAMLLSVTTMACSGFLNEATQDEGYHLTGGVAATVKGVNITEDTVTNQIMSLREAYGYDSDEDWAQYLADSGLTPESYREQVIDSYAQQYLLTAAQNEYNITVSDEEIQEAWDEAVSAYDSEDAFIEQLSTFGYTEESYKESLGNSLAQEKLRDEVAPVDEPTDDDIVAYFNENSSALNDARRSSNLLIKVDSDASDDEKAEAKATAEDVLAKINAGDLTFEEAVEEYSDDTASAPDGGDVGWDKLTTFVTEYQDALSQLGEGDVSGVVETSYGYHIIKCTELFHVDGELTKADEIPEEIRDAISDAIVSEEQGAAYTEWWENYQEQADLEINPMPEDVPYNVDMNLATAGSGSAE
ncbi:peptidylprolyl isomerase [Collinsella tanakaei]|uniref:peptidylprolyl isomerase n=1 Tax=Collinsella tanakaei TaxID=626935 RepID=UPI0025A47DB6|nr:peptidylprolyl isomerase [Collinsella tanakaei]MDM8302355.1 peptidylprolyl isomerase [Collinsella tanakaei]